MDDYSWVTDEMFDDALMEIVEKEGLISLLRIEGVYELVKEHYNNKVLEKLEQSRWVRMKREYTFAGLFTVEQVKRIEELFMLFEEEEKWESKCYSQ